MSDMGTEARAIATIICREVLDILDSELKPDFKLKETRDLIASWVNANKLNIAAVQRMKGMYRLESSAPQKKNVGKSK